MAKRIDVVLQSDIADEIIGLAGKVATWTSILVLTVKLDVIVFRPQPIQQCGPVKIAFDRSTFVVDDGNVNRNGPTVQIAASGEFAFALLRSCQELVVLG